MPSATCKICVMPALLSLGLFCSAMKEPMKRPGWICTRKGNKVCIEVTMIDRMWLGDCDVKLICERSAESACEVHGKVHAHCAALQCIVTDGTGAT